MLGKDAPMYLGRAAELATQGAAGRDILDPGIHVQGRVPGTRRPKSLNEKACSVGGRNRVIGAF